jgi:hypothetical protein
VFGALAAEKEKDLGSFEEQWKSFASADGGALLKEIARIAVCKLTQR